MSRFAKWCSVPNLNVPYTQTNLIERLHTLSPASSARPREFKGTKTEEPRLVSLPASTLAALDHHRQKQAAFRAQFGPDYRADLDLIFANPDGTPLKPDSTSAAVSLLFRRLRLPKGASLHSLRHSHCSLLLADGVDLATVSERLGHSSVRVTSEIYAHAIRGRDQEAAQRWDKLMHPCGGSREEPTGVN
jgi:integrase